jgi:hypothetical protein
MQWRQTGEWRYSSTTLDLSTRWRWVVGFMFWPLSPEGKCPQYPLDRRLGGLQSRSGCHGEKSLAPEPVWMTWRRENYCPHQDSNSDPSRPAHSQSLYWPSYPSSPIILCMSLNFVVVTTGKTLSLHAIHPVPNECLLPCLFVLEDENSCLGKYSNTYRTKESTESQRRF